MEPLIEVKNLKQEFHLTKGLLQSLRVEHGKVVKEEKIVHAVNDVSSLGHVHRRSGLSRVHLSGICSEGKEHGQTAGGSETYTKKTQKRRACSVCSIGWFPCHSSASHDHGSAADGEPADLKLPSEPGGNLCAKQTD